MLILDIPLYFACVVLAFLVQWLLFIPAFLLKTEKFFDLAGSFTFILVTFVALMLNDDANVHAKLIAICVCGWALRLGIFLHWRTRRASEDRRFRSIKKNGKLFFMTWTMQGLWVAFAYAAGLVVLTTAESHPHNVFTWTGLALWIVGISFETLADRQKTTFRNNPENKDKFITTGLWSWSQHPNYFGEILLWIGIALIAFPYLDGFEYAALISPLFVWFLLTQISGTRMLDNLAAKKWGEDEAYSSYTQRTSKLIPWLPKRR